MSTDTDITRSLREAADGAEVPRLDLDALRAGGRRQARRRMGMIAAAAALAVAAAGGAVAVGVDGPDDVPVPPARRTDVPTPTPTPTPTQQLPRNPQRVAELPQGEPPALPYVTGDVLTVGGVVTDMEGDVRLQGLRYGGSVTLGLRSDGSVVLVEPNGDLSLLDGGVPGRAGYPSVSPEGRFAAWEVTRDGRDPEVVVWSVGESRVVDRFTVPERPQCCTSGFEVTGVTDRARVFVHGDQAVYVHDFQGGDPVAVTNLDPAYDRVLTSAAGILVAGEVRGQDGYRHFRVGNVSGDRLRAHAHRKTGLEGAIWWSPYDHASVSQDLLRAKILWELFPGGMYDVPQAIAVPRDVDVNGVAWESSDAMLLEVTEGQHEWWLRCYAQNLRCEVAADLGKQGPGREIIVPTR